MAIFSSIKKRHITKGGVGVADGKRDMVRTENLIYEYQSEAEDTAEVFTALRGVDIAIEKGSFVAVLGHNGSGKSTLAKHLNALLIPKSGTVWVNGIDTRDDARLWDVRQSVGMVFQNPDNQIIATIVEEDVAFGPENLGVKQAEIGARVAEALAAVGMSTYTQHSPHFLSGGQKQRITIAGVLAMKPQCIVLDEPTAMLDPVGRKEVVETVKRLNREEGITVVLITHYMDEAVQADRVIVMEEGAVVMDGTPQQVFRRIDELKAIGLDVPQVTEIAHLLRRKGVSLPNDILTIEEMVGAICRLKSEM